MNDVEKKLREEFVQCGRSLYERGYATGAAGNMSLVLPDNTVITTPTGSCLGTLDVDELSKVDMSGNLIEGPRATKEVKLHLAVYRQNPDFKAIVHLHSTYATAYSCLDSINVEDAIKPFTPYVVMRMGKVKVVPYHKPGSDSLVADLESIAKGYKAFLLANHGPVIAGKTLTEALNNAEELEATCRLFFILSNSNKSIRYLSDNEIQELINHA